MLCICQGQHAYVQRSQQGEQDKPVQKASLLLYPFKTFFLHFSLLQRARPSFVTVRWHKGCLLCHKYPEAIQLLLQFLVKPHLP